MAQTMSTPRSCGVRWLSPCRASDYLWCLSHFFRTFGSRCAITGHFLHALPLCWYDLQHFVFTPVPRPRLQHHATGLRNVSHGAKNVRLKIIFMIVCPDAPPLSSHKSRPRMSEAVPSGNVAKALTISNACGSRYISPTVCAKTSHNRDLMAP